LGCRRGMQRAGRRQTLQHQASALLCVV
jgi:hypothetical protein